MVCSALLTMLAVPVVFGASTLVQAPSRTNRPGRTAVPAGWAWVDPGTFQMGCVPNDRECRGNEAPRHEVTLTRGFFVMLTEVTVGMFTARVAPAGVALPRQPFWSTTADHPVVNVTWDEARRFCEGAFHGRLPTEAEWEFAARGGTSDFRYPWGSSFNQALANGLGVRRGDPWEQAAPVASYPPNDRGMYDVVGNVWEWTSDWYQSSYYGRSPKDDPRGPAQGDARSVRGGSWDSAPRHLRVSARWPISARARYPLYVGFRCVADGPGAPPALTVSPRSLTENSPRR